jgi:superfamily II DNA or RNA helicase
VLFLRPTESSTVFLQQLGRGLRRAKDKAVLTAFDFVATTARSSASTSGSEP